MIMDVQIGTETVHIKSKYPNGIFMDDLFKCNELFDALKGVFGRIILTYENEFFINHDTTNHFVVNIVTSSRNTESGYVYDLILDIDDSSGFKNDKVPMLIIYEDMTIGDLVEQLNGEPAIYLKNYNNNKIGPDQYDWKVDTTKQITFHPGIMGAIGVDFRYILCSANPPEESPVN